MRVSGAWERKSFWCPSLPYEVGALELGPLNPAMGQGSTVSFPGGVWSKAPAANDFGAF